MTLDGVGVFGAAAKKGGREAIQGLPRVVTRRSAVTREREGKLLDWAEDAVSGSPGLCDVAQRQTLFNEAGGEDLALAGNISS